MYAFARSFGCPLLAAVGLIALLNGCGVSEYNALVDRGLTNLRAGAKFKFFYAPSPLPELPITVRVPMVFPKSYRADSGHRDDGETINPDRLQPPFLKLPGFALCYEGTSQSGNTKLPFYCYLAAVPASSADAQKLAAQLQADLKKAFPESDEEWEQFDADTPTGKSIHWQKIRAEGEQPFLVKTDKVATENLPGVFELWMHDSDDYIVLIGWRAPNSVLGTLDIADDELSPLRLAIEGPPKDAKFDVKELPPATAGTLEFKQ